MVLGLAHFTFCHTSSLQNPASKHARILPITLHGLVKKKSKAAANDATLSINRHYKTLSPMRFDGRKE